jgi:PBP1b-binding outer membrane lipoprotein LpoB
MAGKIDPLFANHPDILAMEKQTQRFVDEFRARASTDLDALHQKENEIAGLTSENLRLRRVLDQISREGECVYARRLALDAVSTSPLSSQQGNCK